MPCLTRNFIVDGLFCFQEIKSITNDSSAANSGHMYEQYCKMVPILKKQAPSSGDSGENVTCPSADQVERMTCAEMSILELWVDGEGNYDEAAIDSLTTVEEVCFIMTWNNGTG